MKNLGELIKSKGMLMYFIRHYLNKNGIPCNKSTFSKWCTGIHKPKNPAAYFYLSEILNEEVETIKNIMKNGKK